MAVLQLKVNPNDHSYNCRFRSNVGIFFTHAIKNCCCPLNTCGFASFAFCFIRQESFSMLCKPAAKVSHNWNDSFGAIFVDRDEESKASSLGKDLHVIKQPWRKHRQRQNTPKYLMSQHSQTYTQKKSESRLLQGGRVGSWELTELDETVLDVLGRKSANIEPVKVIDSDIVFGDRCHDSSLRWS